MDGSSHLRCLIPKIRALVSNFPVLEASMASSTNTTVKSPSPFLCKDMKGRIRISSKGRQQLREANLMANTLL